MGESKNRAGEAMNTAKEEKKEKGVMEAVFKVNTPCGPCEGCAEKFVKFVRAFDGVKTAETNLKHDKIKVVGEIDPSKLLEKIKMKTKGEVELEPQKKDKDRRGGGGDEKLPVTKHGEVISSVKEGSGAARKNEKGMETGRADCERNELPVVKKVDQPKVQKTRHDQKEKANTKTSGRKEKKARHERKKQTPNKPPVTNASVKSGIRNDTKQIGLTVSNTIGVQYESTDPCVDLEVEGGIQEEDGSPPPKEEEDKKKKGKGACINLSFNFKITNNFSLVHVPFVPFFLPWTRGKGRRSVSPITEG